MTPRVRNAVLMYGLLGAWAAFLLTYPASFSEMQRELWGAAGLSLWAGGVHGIPLLLAAWAALSDQPLVSRLPNSTGVLVTFGLCVIWGASNYVGGQAVADVVPLFGITYTAAICILLLVRLKWSIESTNQVRTDRPVQFTVRRALTWTLAVGVFFGVAKMTLPEWPPRLPVPADWPTHVVYPLAVTVLGAPLMLTAIGLVLGERHRMKYGIGLVVLSAFAASVIAARLIWNLGLTTRNSALEPLTYAFCTVIGFVATTIGTLLVFRIAGYHLKSRGT